MTSPSAADLEMEFYERFFLERGLEPYPVQEQAIEKIFRGESVLVTVPTGTGKTLMAKAGIMKALAEGKRAIYTTPLRALTEEKFRELCEDFGEERVGFATGDYRVRPEAPVQVLVAEILWNRIFGDRAVAPAEIVVMDEGHYFNDPERGHVWEQSIIGLDARTQLVILSATIGEADAFCQWVYLCRRVPMALCESHERKVPLRHDYRETYLIDLVKELRDKGETPAILFTFNRELCFERARLLKSCPRFTSDAQRTRIGELANGVLLDRGFAKDLWPLLQHGIGIHHAGILPRYKQLIEQLTLERLLSFVVSTETISAGINLPAHTVVFPELRKFIQGKPRLLTSAEYHQMSGRAGRPQFDSEGLAVTLAPEEVVHDIREELRAAKKGRMSVDEEKLRKSAYARHRSEIQRKGEITWDPEAHGRLVRGQPAPLRSQTRITAEQILAIGLPDLSVEALPGAALSGEEEALPEPELPASLKLNIVTVIDHLLVEPRQRVQAQKRLAQVTANLRALEVIDERGVQVKGEVIGKLRGIDGLFVYYCLMSRDLGTEECRALCEYLVDHDAIHRRLTRKEREQRKEWIRNRLRERRREEPQVAWEDVEAEYEERFPRELTPLELLHGEFAGKLPHPELHGGKIAKAIWAEMEDAGLSFMEMVEKHGLELEEGNLFSYLARVMKVARMLAQASGVEGFATVEAAVRRVLAEIDSRVESESF
jgi:superfamily II RNA helicase